MRPRVSFFLDPLSDRYPRDAFFGDHPLGDYFGTYRHIKTSLEAIGIPVHTGDFLLRGEYVSDLNLYATTGMRTTYERVAQREDVVLSAFIVQECPIVEPRLFADLPSAGKRFRRMYSYAPDSAMERFVGTPITFRPLRYAYPYDSVVESAWAANERSFMAIINGNKVPRLRDQEPYTERLRAVEYFDRHGEIDLYGVGWDGPPFRVGETRVPRIVRRAAYRAERAWDKLRPSRDPLLAASRRAYRGPVASKPDTLSRYTFSICFENMVFEGWVTEKIFDCLRAGTVPVYLGAPDIERWVWPECFVDMRKFAGYDELREFLHDLSPREIDAYRQVGREYFASEEFRPFTKETFAEIFLEIVREDTGIAP